ISLFIVDATTPGIRTEVIPTMGMDKLCEVRFENVAVPRENMLGGLDKGWPIVEKVLRKGAIAKCAEAVGGMQASLDMCVAYSKERVQYERPIGAFQVLQHWMADMYIKVQTSKYLVYEAAWMETNGMPCDRQASEAKAYVNEAYKWMAERAVRLHGGIGTTRDHDIGLYFRRSEASATAYGGTDYHKDRVAGLMGLKMA
ncbi:MAG: acyl-CoA dehydrogenase, partial [Dehalococcoidia bacterium]|nr:acyl-CoA dehydrogenase [Dehalococcoidia bacterium]